MSFFHQIPTLPDSFQITSSEREIFNQKNTYFFFFFVHFDQNIFDVQRNIWIIFPRNNNLELFYFGEWRRIWCLEEFGKLTKTDRYS